MSLPAIIMPKTIMERIHSMASIALLVFTFIYLLVKWTDIPDTVAMHYNAAGEADGWGSKYTLVIMPLLMLLFYIGLSILAKFPHKFNYPVPVTDRNRSKLFNIGRQLISWLSFEIILLFAYIEWKIIQGAIENTSNLGVPFFVMLGALFVTIIYYMVRMFRS